MTTNTINFIIPGLYEHKELNSNLLTLLEKKPEYFRENIKINAVYGNFKYSTWDGGRIFMDYQQVSKEEIESLQKMYNEKYKIPMRFVFTNNQLKEEDCYDRFNNLVLHICHNPMNEIVVNSEILYEYIKTNFPEYKFVSSTTKCIINPEESKNEIKDKKYFLTCIDYNLNKNWKFLNSIPKEERAKVEILINAICPAGCQSRKEHYRLNSLFNLSYGKKYDLPTCGIKSNTLDPLLEKGNNLSPDEIFNKYVPNGFINFKIEGRTLSSNEMALNYAKFLTPSENNLFITQVLLSMERKFKNLVYEN